MVAAILMPHSLKATPEPQRAQKWFSANITFLNKSISWAINLLKLLKLTQNSLKR
jgi:hypothetical protein